MKAWLQRLMYGRYGQDDLNRFLSVSALVLCLVSVLIQGPIVSSLAMVLMFFCLFRMFSRNTEKRGRENLAFLRAKERITQFFSLTKNRISQRKTHRFYACPSCKRVLRVPRGKGLIRIHCPNCRTAFEKRT